MSETPALIVFARVPRAGQVKTRLAASIGVTAALQVYRDLLESTLQRTRGSRAPIRLLYIDGEDLDGHCAELARRFGMRLERQVGADLGQRMANALEDQLRDARLPVLIGCDLPVIDATYLDAAFDALASHDAVFAPAEDGGYGLVGLRRMIPELFFDQPWGSSQVMARARQSLRGAAASWCELDEVWDVDEVCDLERWLDSR
jgi:rSAM/selenodomain-associated transferase 1